jgi:uncharacterized protein (DUF4415 family)
MKQEYDFSRGERGALDPAPPGKTRITIHLDNEVLGWFRGKVNGQGGSSYQTLMNQALHDLIERDDLEKTLRRVLREEQGPPEAGVTRSARS